MRLLLFQLPNKVKVKLIIPEDSTSIPPAVPEPEITLPTSIPPSSRLKTSIQALIFYRTKRINDHVVQWERKGYNLSWASSYKFGQTPRAYYNMVFHNSTSLKTRGFLELGLEALKQKITDMKPDGYSLRYISCRMKKAVPYEPLFAAIFGQVPDIIETEVYMQDSVATYLARLREKREQGYQLVSHCFSHRPEDGRVDASSVYTRDRRVAFNISVPPPVKWVSYYNLTFFDYTEVALNHSHNNMYLSFLDLWNYEGAAIRSPESFFACVFTERLTNDGAWFRWGMNTTQARDLVTKNSNNWFPDIVAGYSYLGTLSHYVQFKRKQQY